MDYGAKLYRKLTPRTYILLDRKCTFRHVPSHAPEKSTLHLSVQLALRTYVNRFLRFPLSNIVPHSSLPILSVVKIMIFCLKYLFSKRELNCGRQYYLKENRQKRKEKKRKNLKKMEVFEGVVALYVWQVQPVQPNIFFYAHPFSNWF